MNRHARTALALIARVPMLALPAFVAGMGLGPLVLMLPIGEAVVLVLKPRTP